MLYVDTLRGLWIKVPREFSTNGKQLAHGYSLFATFFGRCSANFIALSSLLLDG
jgi:hypothetical protein